MSLPVLAALALLVILPGSPLMARPQDDVAPQDVQRRFPPRSPIDQLDRLMRMPPEQREQILSKLPPARRFNLERRLEQYSRLSPEQRELLRAQYNWFHNLPPEKQFQLRRAFARFAIQPPDRQDNMRAELELLRGMPRAQRWQRMGSPDFRTGFKPNERDIIGQIVDLMP